MADNPSNYHIGGGELIIDDESVGLTTEDGVVVHVEPDTFKHTSAKHGSTPIKAQLLGRKVTLEAVIGEYTLENINRTFAGAVMTDGKIQLGGLAGQEIEGKFMKIQSFDGTGTWYFRNVIPDSAVEVNYDSKNGRYLKVTFTAMVDADAPVETNLGYFGS